MIIVPISANEILPQGKFTPLASGGVLIVGQEQDDMGGFFDSTQSLSGKISQVEIWSKELDSFQIADLAQCRQMTIDIPERIVKWESADWTVKGNASVKEESLQSLCQASPLLNKFIWPQKISYNTFKVKVSLISSQFSTLMKYSPVCNIDLQQQNCSTIAYFMTNINVKCCFRQNDSKV